MDFILGVIWYVFILPTLIMFGIVLIIALFSEGIILYPFRAIAGYLKEQEYQRQWEEQRPAREAAELERQKQENERRQIAEQQRREHKQRQAEQRAEQQRRQAEAQRQAVLQRQHEEQQRQENRRLAAAYRASRNPSIALRTCKNTSCNFNNPGDSKACNGCGADLFNSANYIGRWICGACQSTNVWNNQTCHGCHGQTRPPDYMWEILY